MKQFALFLAASLIIPTVAFAQSYSDSFVAAPAAAEGGEGQTASPVGGSVRGSSDGIFSRVGVGAGLSPLGIQLQAATNISRHFNVRATGNFFNYSTTFTSSGITADAKLNLASAGAALDFYPFHAGFRLSPGVLFYNQNQLTATTDVPAGTSFTLNGTTYYSANANSATGATPITGAGTLGLNTNKAAFTITTGWGNIAKHSGHWSFPFELGVAFLGAPTVKVNLSGWACTDQAQTECTDISDPANPIAVAVQSNLTAQVAKWTSDINPLKTYPIVSGGVAYTFHVR